MKTNMVDYRNRVKSAAKRRNGEAVFNGSIDHAAIVVESLFANANRYVDVLTGELNPRVYGREEIIEQAKLFLASSDHRLRILLDAEGDLDVHQNPFFCEINENDNVEARRVPAELAKLYLFHFAVADDDCYRFEHNKANPSAIAVFGDQAGASNFASIFSKLWALSVPLSLRETSSA